MKAVIVEIKDSVAAALCEDGRVSKIKNKNYAIGQEIILKNNNKYIKLAASAAAALTLFATPAWAYLTPYSYVSLDINPSFEFSINMFDRVLEVRAVNDDGEKVVESISIAELKNKEIKEAVKNVLVELKDQGYIIHGEEGGVVVATSSKNQEKTDKLATSLRTTVEEEVTFKTDKDKQIKDNKETTENEVEEPVEQSEEFEKTEEDKESKEEKEAIKEQKESEKEQKTIEKEAVKQEKVTEKTEKAKFVVEVIEVSQNDVEEAKSNGVTPGKWNLVEKLKESAENAGETFGEDEFNDWLDKPVKSIMNEIKRYDKEVKQESKDNKDNKDNKEDKKTDQESNKENKSNNKN